ncbi:hypothetical protein AMTR_s00138p00053610 [Amborella trichopoda]|uniref:Uncharacterized protein n=1 Tax=Amborella trichopoda TaxID=13333 RepID=W1NEK3_AMBTC|nr:hypothetical protein AMTR_s00138p00053610 [Amborella trichopoda]
MKAVCKWMGGHLPDPTWIRTQFGLSPSDTDLTHQVASGLNSHTQIGIGLSPTQHQLTRRRLGWTQIQLGRGMLDPDPSCGVHFLWTGFASQNQRTQTARIYEGSNSFPKG